MSLIERIKSWFTKASATTRAVVLMTYTSGNQGIAQKRDYEAFAREGYEANVTVYACVREIAMATAGVSWLLYRKGTGRGARRLQEIEGHPFLKLWDRPNPWQGGSRFREAVTAYLLIAGNSYIERVGPTSGPPRELYTLRPDRMTIIPDSKNMIAGYKYKAGGTEISFLNGEILHLKLFSATDDWYGLSPLQVAARDVDSDSESKKWNFNLLSNSARPPGALSTDAPLSDQQFERLKKQIEDKYQGAENAGRPLLLEGGLKWESFALSPEDMDWVEGRKLSKSEIAQVFGVPGELIGIQDQKTYANYQEARKAFYLETVLPYLDWFRDDLNNWLTPLFGERLYLDYDRDDIEALQEDRAKTWERIQKADWITINEKRAATGYDEIEGGDVILVPATMVPISSEETTPANGGDE